PSWSNGATSSRKMRSAAPASIQVSLIRQVLVSGLRGHRVAGRRGSRGGRQFAANEIGRVLELPQNGWDDLAIGGDGARIGRRAIRLDRLMKLGQRVIRDRREQVVLHVVVHVPVEEPE